MLPSRSDDMYAPESIELLTKSGINFKRHEEYGISVEEFGELLISSGLVLLDEVQWVSFHRCVGPQDSFGLASSTNASIADAC